MSYEKIRGSCESGRDGGPDERCCRHVLLFKQQSLQIEELNSKLNAVMAERDVLLCEVSRLKFELEIADLKRINDDRYTPGLPISLLNIIYYRLSILRGINRPQIISNDRLSI